VTFDRAKSLGYLASRLSRQLTASLQVGLNPLGLTPGQFAVLLELDAADGLTQADLSARLRVEQPSMAQTIARLRRNGLVRQSSHESDRRATRLWLTDKARDAIPPAVEAAERTNERALRPLAPGEADALLAGLRRLLDESR
jgi:DNA-binding MarR family transcriptional regulator